MPSLIVALSLTICSGFGLLQRYAPFASVIGPRQKRLLYITYAVVSVVHAVVLTMVFRIRGLMSAFTYLRFGGILYSAVLLLVNISVIRGRIREHLFVFGVVITCDYLLLSVPNYAITFITQPSDTVYLFAVLEIYIAVLLLTYWPLRLLLRRTVTPFLEMNKSESWHTVWFMPLAMFGTKFLSLGGEHNTGSLEQLISSMLYIFVIVLLCLSIVSGQKHLRERKRMEQLLSDQKLQYAELKGKVEDARRIRHDFKNYLASIRQYVQTGEKEGLLVFCDELSERFGGEHDTIPYTGNIAVDGVLYHYMQRARQEQVEFKYSGTINSRGIADIDLGVLLGNALDNALAGALTVPTGRSVSIISHTEERILSVVVRNSFDGKVLESEKGLLSRKRENEPGIGMASMRSVCERYGGSMETYWDEHHFTVVVLLPLSENP